jgi:hypothetical protein
MSEVKQLVQQCVIIIYIELLTLLVHVLYLTLVDQLEGNEEEHAKYHSMMVQYIRISLGLFLCDCTTCKSMFTHAFPFYYIYFLFFCNYFIFVL